MAAFLISSNISSLRDVRMNIGSLVLENEVKSCFHLLCQEAIKVCLEFVSLGLSQPGRWHCLVVLLYCDAEHSLLELSLKQSTSWV